MKDEPTLAESIWGKGPEMAWRRSSAARTYLTAVWAHSTAGGPSGSSQSDFEGFWRTCPSPRACTSANTCMLVRARGFKVWRARNALHIARDA